MGALLVTVLGLGIAGLDPAGALIAAAALTAGARDRAVLLYGVVVLVGTALLGTVLSLTLGARLASVDWSVLVPAGRVGAILEIAVGAGLLAWAVIRLRRRGARTPRPRRERTGSLGLAGVGALFALSAALDPTFIAVVVLAGRDAVVAEVALAHALWAVVSQAPLVLLLVAVARGRHQRAVTWFASWWSRAQPVVRRVVTAALILTGVVLLFDGGWWFATGDYLLPEP
jgi:cytochrome c biogenesis protein CcdA